MSKLTFDGALQVLGESPDERTLLKALIAIRTEIEWPKNKENITKLREKACLKHLVTILQTQQKQILDVSLSILGNCIMDKGCARDVIGTYNILSPLNQLLKRYPKKDSINGRIFRILGNMCHHRDQWANIIIDRKPQLVTHIVEFIKKVSKDELSSEEKYSDGTVMMAVRTLRLLLNFRTILLLVKTFGVLKAVGSLFIKLSIEWQAGKDNKILLDNIIKLLHDYSKYKFYQSITEMRNTERGDSLIHLSNVLLLSPKRIVKIIMNFIRISQLKSELPIPEICDRFLDEMLKKNLNTKEFDEECVEYIQCLCYLLEHPANRNSARCGKCLPILIQVLDGFKEPISTRELECCILLVSTLNQCHYDDFLIQEQLKCDVIQVLLRKLQWLVGNSNKLNVSHKKLKRKSCDLWLRRLQWIVGESEPINLSRKRRKCYCNGSPVRMNATFGSPSLLMPQSPTTSEENFRISQYSPYSSEDEMNLFLSSRYVRSPSPSSSMESDMQAFSWSSPCSSPQYLTNDTLDSDSDNYSPVCSEADSTEFPLPSDEDMSLVDDDTCSEVAELKEEDSSEPPSTEENPYVSLKVRLLSEIAKLIKSYTKIRPPITQLGMEELLLALLKSSEYLTSTLTSTVNTIEIICRILESTKYLIPLMKTEFIETVYSLTVMRHNKNCSRCVDLKFLGQAVLKKFTELVESAVGKGDVAHVLLKGSKYVKEQLVLAIPYIVKSKYILAKLMVDCGGLNILMHFLMEDTSLKERTIKVLCVMASKKLHIANPKQVAITYYQQEILDNNQYKRTEDCTSIVTFKLDDGTSLKADREFLSEKSDYFSRLLNGHFKESSEDEISLQNVNVKSLSCLLRLLKHIEKMESVAIKLDLDTLLDVIVLSDRYLMTDVCSSLTSCVEKHRISPKTVPIIYRWSLESGTNLLRVEAIAFALVANIKEAERHLMFTNLFALGYSEELVDDIQKLLVRYMSSFTSEKCCQ